MIHERTVIIRDLDALDLLAKTLSQQIPPGSWVYLEGDLGAGKTAFSKAFIRHKDCDERVTSPTYALMQDYETNNGVVIHCDLYRLGDPEELYEIGLLEQAQESAAVVLVEWPSKAFGVLPSANYSLHFDFIENNSRKITIKEHR